MRRSGILVALVSLVLPLTACEDGLVVGDPTIAAHVAGGVAGPNGQPLADQAVRAEAVDLSASEHTLTDDRGRYEMRLAAFGGGRRRSDVRIWVEPDDSLGLAFDTVRRESVTFTRAGGDTVRADFRLRTR